MTLLSPPDRAEIEPALADAKELVGWIHGQLHDLKISGADRCKIPGLLFDIAIEQHAAIVQLIDARLYAGAYALVRSEFEAFVRGLWLHHCATDAQIDKFLRRDDIPKIGALIDEVEAMDGFGDKILSGIMANAWKGMNGYSHSGTHQITRRMSEGTIEPNYRADEILEVLRFADTMAQMALAEIAQMAGEAELLAEIQGRIGPSEDAKASE